MPSVAVVDESEMRRLGSELMRTLAPGDVVLLEGPLGAGKTTLVRGALESLGHRGPVRSPTYNLLQTFRTKPPVLHADLYRLRHARDLGLEDYLTDHVAFIEWPDRLAGFLDPGTCTRVLIAFGAEGRMVTIVPPSKDTVG